MKMHLVHWRAVVLTLTVWLVAVGATGFLTLVWMRECSSQRLAMAVAGAALAALVLSIGLAVAGRATTGRVALIVLASWASFYIAYRVCNRPNPETLEYLRSLGKPSSAEHR